MNINDYRLIIDQDLSGQENMDKDIELVEQLKSNPDSTPVFRLYTWQPWCLSLGYHQKTDKIDTKKLLKNGFEMVRRPTGGRAVFHANELTYSVVTRITNSQTKQDVYRDIHLFISEILKSLGVVTDITKANPDFRSLYKSEDRSVSCFASSARYELTFNGKKIVGSAQRKFGDILLQHGSILLDYGYEKISDFVIADPAKRGKLKEITKNTTIPINKASEKKILLSEMINKFRKSFKQNEYAEN